MHHGSKVTENLLIIRMLQSDCYAVYRIVFLQYVIALGDPTSKRRGVCFERGGLAKGNMVDANMKRLH